MIPTDDADLSPGEPSANPYGHDRAGPMSDRPGAWAGAAARTATAGTRSRLAGAVPHALARFNRRLLSPVMRPVAAWLPGMAVVHHTGRRSGRPFRTPVRVFRDRATYYVMIAGQRTPEWVRNLDAAHGGVLQVRGRSLAIARPRLTDAPEALASAPRWATTWRSSLGLTRFVALPSTDRHQPEETFHVAAPGC